MCSSDLNDAGQLRFQYAGDWLADPARLALSQSLPLRPEPFDSAATRPFFAGLLPEAEKRDLIAQALGVSTRNDFALLDGIGGECAGAITFVQPGNKPPSEPAATDYRRLNEAQLAKILTALPTRPLLVGEEGVRLSLAGAQDKLPVLLVNAGIALPLHSAPSSHIIKPPIRRFADTVHNEGFCLALAAEAGLHVIKSDIRQAKDEVYLLVERYDRQRDPSGVVRRLHQEDLCQALGYPPEIKYQAEGGPTLRQCFDMVRRATARPVVELARLLDAVIFNLLVGNNDAHSKNYSLLHADRGTELAPIYDVSSTIVYPDLSPRFAMAIGDQKEFSDLHPRHFERFAKEAGLGAAPVRRRLLELAEQLPNAAREVQNRFKAAGHDRPIITNIVSTIGTRARQLRKRFEA